MLRSLIAVGRFFNACRSLRIEQSFDTFTQPNAASLLLFEIRVVLGGNAL